MKNIIYLSSVTITLLLFCGCIKTVETSSGPTSSSGVSTYAGTGVAGLGNGNGTAAEFNHPLDIALDNEGAIYISEQGNNLIRKIFPGGQVVTFAGNGTIGYKDGPGTSAEFNNPEGMAIDETGNVYVADAGNNVIREISPNGQVSTYAGTGKSGYLDGAALSAQFNVPTGLAIDKSKNIYVTDYANNVIRKITTGGQVSTFAGTGTAGFTNGSAASATFRAPSGITIDGSGNLFIAEGANSAIREISPSGAVTTFAGSLPGPGRVAVDVAGNLYVSCGNNTIQKISSTGVVSVYAGSGTPGFQDGPLLTAQFLGPLGLITNAYGVLVVVDYGNNRIRIVTP